MSNIYTNPEEQKSVENLEKTPIATLDSDQNQANLESKIEEGDAQNLVSLETIYSDSPSEEITNNPNTSIPETQSEGPKEEPQRKNIKEKVSLLNANLDEFESFLEEKNLETFINYIQQFASGEINRNNIRKVGRLKKAFDQLYQSEVRQIKNIPETDIAARDKERERLNNLKTKFETGLQKFNERKNEFEEKEKKIKQANIDKKKSLLEELREIVMSEDVTAIEKVRKIQEEWRKIGPVPAEEAEDIYQTYRHFIDQFFRLRENYNELVEQDRKINLEEKEKLINELIALIPKDTSKVEPKYWQEAAEKVKRLHELWKTIGPVPRSKSDEIWQRFKDYTDQFYSQRRSFFEELDNQRSVNEKRKRELLAEFEKFAKYESSDLEDWKKASEDVSKLREEWKKIGRAPSASNKELNNQMNKLLNAFYERRNSRFEELDQERKQQREESLQKRKLLLDRAEQLKDNEDWAATAEMLKQIQKQWKDTGPDDYKEARKLRKKFRKACDSFFNRHKEHLEKLREEEEDNLKKKQEICDKLKKILEKPDPENNKEEVQKLKEQFDSIKRVPLKERDKVNGLFNKLYKDFFRKTVKNPEEMDMIEIMILKDQPNKIQRIKQLERKYIKKIRALEDKIKQYETNKEFISQNNKNNKGSDSFLKKEIESKIASAKEQKRALEEYLAKIRQILKGSSNHSNNNN